MIFRSKSTNLICAIASCTKPNTVAMNGFQFVPVVTAKLNQFAAFIAGQRYRFTHVIPSLLSKRLNPEHNGKNLYLKGGR